MKKRTLLTNIFIVILMVAIVFVLLAFFEVFPNKYQAKILFASMSVALVSVALVDIVFPLIDNIRRFIEETPYKIKTFVKILLFIVAIVFLLCTVRGVSFFADPQFVGIALFCVAYLAQFFIDLDKNKKAELEDDEDEDYEYEDEAYDSDNESYASELSADDDEFEAYDDDDSFDVSDDESK